MMDELDLELNIDDKQLRDYETNLQDFKYLKTKEHDEISIVSIHVDTNQCIVQTRKGKVKIKENMLTNTELQKLILDNKILDYDKKTQYYLKKIFKYEYDVEHDDICKTEVFIKKDVIQHSHYMESISFSHVLPEFQELTTVYMVYNEKPNKRNRKLNKTRKNQKQYIG